jgi:hypothetical protein
MANTSKPSRQSHLRWVPADELNVNPVAQREFRPAWAETILSQFDINKFQVPHVNRREDGSLYIMEGQHGIWAYRQYFGEGEQINVWMYEGLSEQEEAEFFLSLNNKKTIDAMSRFKVSVTANRELESDIDRIVRANGCFVGLSSEPNYISAVGTLTRIYSQYGPRVLGATLRVISGAFSEGGFERPVLLGVAMVLARYADIVDEVHLVKQLAKIRNGWKGLVQKTSLTQATMGVKQPEAAAAAVVEFYNAGRGGKRLTPWFRAEELAA